MSRQRRIHIVNIVVGLFFMVVAACAFFDQFRDAHHVATVLPALLVVVGVSVIGAGIARLIERP
jgi:hypothetical protein